MSDALTAEPAAAPSEPAGTGPHHAPDSPGRVSELRVSAHLMTLETGLYCVFPTQGSPEPDSATGLPGVRVTPAPGIAGRPEAVSISTFREDGWLNGTAALVRVTDGRAQILVSVYQNLRQGQAAAPRLQVLRLSREADAAATEPGASGNAAPPRPAVPPDPNPEIMAHVQRLGDLGGKIGDWIGVKGGRNWVEGFGLGTATGLAPEDIEYQGVLGRNWLSPWIEGGKYCGSRGMALPLLGLKVRLKGDAARTFECSYSATFVDGTAIGPVSAGEPCEAASLAPLEALQIVIRPRAGEAAGPAAPKHAANARVTARTATPVAAKAAGPTPASIAAQIAARIPAGPPAKAGASSREMPAKPAEPAKPPAATQAVGRPARPVSGSKLPARAPLPRTAARTTPKPPAKTASKSSSRGR